MKQVNEGGVREQFRRWDRVGIGNRLKILVLSLSPPLTLYKNPSEFHNISGSYVFHLSKGYIWTAWSLVIDTL